MDRLLKVEEAAERLQTSPDWLYRMWKHLPFAVKLSRKQLRFSEEGLQKFLQENQHAGESVQEG